MGCIIQLSIETTSGLRRDVISRQPVKEDFNPGTTRCCQITVKTTTIERLRFRQQSVTRQIPTTKGDIIETISSLVMQAIENTARIKLPISSIAVLSNLMTELTAALNEWPATNWMMVQQNFHGCKTTLAAKMGTLMDQNFYSTTGDTSHALLQRLQHRDFCTYGQWKW